MSLPLGSFPVLPVPELPLLVVSADEVDWSLLGWAKNDLSCGCCMSDVPYCGWQVFCLRARRLLGAASPKCKSMARNRITLEASIFRSLCESRDQRVYD